MDELRTNNLYAGGTVEEYANGEQALMRELITFELDSVDNIYHILTDLERLDTLAYRYYKNKVQDPSKFWWVIADANEILNPLDLTEVIGSRLVIPDIRKILLQI